ncbi:MAG: DUF1559 domain-containing protein, partial [Sphingobacteriales bacterium]
MIQAGKKTATSKHLRRGFTLIELLVVIAIIAILAAILFPVFGRARENARRSSCQINLKQIGLGIMQYTQDYDEKYPGGVMNYLASASTGTYQATWDTIIQPYMKSVQILQCPSDSASTKHTHPLYGPSAYRSYSGAANVMPNIGYYQARSIASIPASALTVVVTHRTNAPANGTDAWNQYATMESLGNQVQFLHLETSNFLYADGHVKSLHGVT